MITSSRLPLVLLAVAAAVSATACVDVAEQRARRDLAVGKATVGDAAVEVEDGLAAVLAFVPGELHLWASAPSLAIRLSGGAAGGPMRITIDNVLPDATLVAGGLPVASTPGPWPTRRIFTLALPPGETIDLTLAAADAAGTAPYRFAVYADVQEAITEVQDLYGRMAADPTIRFALMSGDLTEEGSHAELVRFKEELRTLPFPVYATLGNHELGTRDDLYHEHFGRGSYSFVHAGVRFTLLDSASATLAPAVYDWLAGWLEAGKDGFHVVAIHHPPIDPVGDRNGSFASRAEGAALLARLARAGVDVTFYGHLHSYYAFQNAGIPAYITGGGGAIPERLDGVGRHFLTVDVDPTTQLFQTAIVQVD